MSAALQKVLYIEDDESQFVVFRDLVLAAVPNRFVFDWVATYDAALELMARNEHDAYLVDYRLGDRSGLALLREALARGCRGPQILLTAYGDQALDLEAMKAGAADYLTKTAITADLLERSLRYAIQHKRTEEALRQSERKLRRSLEERERIARDLHDGIIQSIYAIGLRLEDCRRRVREEPVAAEQQLTQSINELNSVIRDVRNSILGLQPEALQGQELEVALKSLAVTMTTEKATRFDLRIDPAAARDLDPLQAIQILQIAREAMSNSLRHANARTTVVSLQRNGDIVRFHVQDDGIGFDPNAPVGGHGLRNLASRARELKAVLQVASQPGQGTTIALDLPMVKTG